MFRIEMLPAGHGDCLWIEYGDPDQPSRILIDGGIVPTYEPLRSRLLAMPKPERHFELLVITHVDGDHIEGILPLLYDKNIDVSARDIWFNGWRHLFKDTSDKLGPVQGEMLSALIRERHLAWNQAFASQSVFAPADRLPEVTLPGGMNIILLSPDRTALARLRKSWQAEVKKAKLDPDDPQAALERYKGSKKLLPADILGEERPDPAELVKEKPRKDSSRANRSSIAFLAEYDNTRVLFGADAHPALLVDSLRRLLAQRGQARLKLDAFKVSHHGADGNLTPELLGLLDCRRYLISTNGDIFGHPHQQAVARILVFGGREKELIFNYRSDFNKVWNDASLVSGFHYRPVYPLPGREGISLEL